MLVQIALGSVLLMLSITISAASAWIMEVAFLRSHAWLMREPHWPKLVLVVGVVSLWLLGIVTVGVWIWALAFVFLGLFPTLEESVYFSLVTFSTLGFGDIIPPTEWRILGSMPAANGFLTFGLLTALMVEALRQVRLGQMEARRKRH